MWTKMNILTGKSNKLEIKEDWKEIGEMRRKLKK
jgi:hypothetical protein